MGLLRKLWILGLLPVLWMGAALAEEVDLELVLLADASGRLLRLLFQDA